MRKRRFTVLLLAAALLFGVLHVTRSILSADRPTLAEIETLPVIIIDPGHGGMDGGAVGQNGQLLEKDINLELSLTLRDLFKVNGFTVVMTRDTDISIHDDGVEGIKKQKTSDLHNRLAIMESYPNAIFISIHQNKFGDSRSWGAQAFYGPKHTQSARLADLLQQQIIAWIQPENHRATKQAGKNLYLLYNAKCPAVLVECGFLSNPADAANLSDYEYQSKMSFAILASVLEYLEMDQSDGAKLQSPT